MYAKPLTNQIKLETLFFIVSHYRDIKSYSLFGIRWRSTRKEQFWPNIHVSESGSCRALIKVQAHGCLRERKSTEAKREA